LSRKGVLERREDDADRRRRIVDIRATDVPPSPSGSRPAHKHGARRSNHSRQHSARTFIDTLRVYAAAVTDHP